MANRNHVAVVGADIPLLVGIAVNQVIVASLLQLVSVSIVGTATVVMNSRQLLAHSALIVTLSNLVLRRLHVGENVLDVHAVAHLVVGGGQRT